MTKNLYQVKNAKQNILLVNQDEDSSLEDLLTRDHPNPEDTSLPTPSALMPQSPCVLLDNPQISLLGNTIPETLRINGHSQ